MLAHANGDAAADMLIEAVRKANPSDDHRTVMIHAQTIEDQLSLMKELGMIPSYFSAHSFFWGDGIEIQFSDGARADKPLLYRST